MPPAACQNKEEGKAGESLEGSFPWLPCLQKVLLLQDDQWCLLNFQYFSCIYELHWVYHENQIKPCSQDTLHPLYSMPVAAVFLTTCRVKWDMVLPFVRIGILLLLSLCWVWVSCCFINLPPPSPHSPLITSSHAKEKERERGYKQKPIGLPRCFCALAVYAKYQGSWYQTDCFDICKTFNGWKYDLSSSFWRMQNSSHSLSLYSPCASVRKRRATHRFFVFLQECPFPPCLACLPCVRCMKSISPVFRFNDSTSSSASTHPLSLLRQEAGLCFSYQ